MNGENHELDLAVGMDNRIFFQSLIRNSWSHDTFFKNNKIGCLKYIKKKGGII